VILGALACQDFCEIGRRGAGSRPSQGPRGLAKAGNRARYRQAQARWPRRRRRRDSRRRFSRMAGRQAIAGRRGAPLVQRRERVRFAYHSMIRESGSFHVIQKIDIVHVKCAAFRGDIGKSVARGHQVFRARAYLERSTDPWQIQNGRL
jgi:hypothetical protein